MADITMCKGGNCPVKEQCTRYTAKAGSYQSYFTKVPYNENTKECDVYWGKNADNIFNQLKDIINGKVP